MDSLLQEITVLPGVFGCFVSNSKGQIAGSKMPPIFKESSIRNIGSILSRTIQMGNAAQLRFKDIEIKFNKFILIVNRLPNEALLIVICEPSANKSLISMTTGMLANDFETAMASSITISQPASHVPAAATVNRQQQQVPKEVDIDAAMAPVLEQIKDALAMAIGPIAGPVMKDAIEIWAQRSPPAPATLPVLTTLLCAEINDTSLEQEFMTAIKKISR